MWSRKIGSSEAEGGRSNKGSLFSRMAGEYRGGKEKEWQMKGFHRFHRLKPGMPKRPIPNAED